MPIDNGNVLEHWRIENPLPVFSKCNQRTDLPAFSLEFPVDYYRMHSGRSVSRGGVRYESKLDASDDITKFSYYYSPGSNNYITIPEIGKYNHDAGDRLYFPATVYLKFRF